MPLRLPLLSSGLFSIFDLNPDFFFFWRFGFFGISSLLPVRLFCTRPTIGLPLSRVLLAGSHGDGRVLDLVNGWRKKTH